MKIVFAVIAFLSFANSSWAQTERPKTKTETTVKEEPVVIFSSESEKAKKIAVIQELIDANKDNPKADLTMYYEQLKAFKNAEVIKIENK